MTWELIVKFYCQSEVDQVRSSEPSMILPIDLHKLSKVQIDFISLFMHHSSWTICCLCEISWLYLRTFMTEIYTETQAMLEKSLGNMTAV